MYAGAGEMKLNQPVAGDAVAAHFRRSKDPLFGRFQCELCEIAAGSGVVQHSSGHAAGRINVDLNADSHGAVNRGEGLGGSFGLDLAQHFSVCA